MELICRKEERVPILRTGDREASVNFRTDRVWTRHVGCRSACRSFLARVSSAGSHFTDFRLAFCSEFCSRKNLVPFCSGKHECRGDSPSCYRTGKAVCPGQIQEDSRGTKAQTLYNVYETFPGEAAPVLPAAFPATGQPFSGKRWNGCSPFPVGKGSGGRQPVFSFSPSLQNVPG